MANTNGDWPGCGQAATDSVPILPGMTLRIDGITFSDDAFGICEEHGPRLAKRLLPQIEDALRRDAARRNLAPGDVEWNEYFGSEGSD